ncbi:MAG: 3'(2'),5'-bisphosphate nucleotidase CysQ [Xanthobacteraceae bacterium]
MQIVDSALAEALTGVVSQAGRAILDIAQQPLVVRHKEDQSPVTAADEAAQTIILDGLAKLMPGVPVVSEEHPDRPSAAALRDLFVLVDPLDGTREFVAGRDEFTVNLAVIEEGDPLLGLVFLPARALLYCGFSDLVAERLHLAPGDPPSRAGEIKDIRTRPRPASGLVAAVSRSHLDEATEAFLGKLPLASRIASGSSLKLGLLAEGEADVYPRLAPTHEWDIAAGHAVLAAAGGAVLRPDGTKLTYGNADAGFLVPGFVAWGDPTAAVKAMSR